MAILLLLSGMVLFGLWIQKNKSPKVLLIGIDGLEWRVLNRLLAQEDLPNISQLIENGGAGVLESIPPLISPAIWTTIATGKKREQHNISYFFSKSRDAYAKINNSSSQRTSKAIWNIFSENGLSSTVIKWQGTYPAEKISGQMVSFLLAGNEPGDAYYPNSLRQEYAAVRIPSHPNIDYLLQLKKRSSESITDQIFNDRIVSLQDILIKDSKNVFLTVKLMNKRQSDLTMVYLSAIDNASHKFWKYQQVKELTDEDLFDTHKQDVGLYSKIIDDIYIYTDFLVGQLTKACPPDTDIIIVSDHGFQKYEFPENVIFMPNRLLSDFHFLTFAEDENINFNNTAVYNISDHYLTKRGLYLNIKGRDPKGIIEKRKLELTLNDIIQKLKHIKNLKGLPLFKSIKSNMTVADNNMLADDRVIHKPDIIFELNSEIQYEDHLVINDNLVPFYHYTNISAYISGAHRKEGVIIVRGRSFKGSEVKNATIIDIAPTILSIFNFPKATDMPGKVLDDILVNPCKQPEPDTYEGYESKTISSGKKISLSKQAEDRLRSLGYVK